MASSSPAIVQLINALFGTDYPLDTPVRQLSTEYVSNALEAFFADILFLVGNDKYLVETQMTDDKEMAFRVFNYGYLDAKKNKIEDEGVIRLNFPRCVVVYLEPTKSTPKEVSVELVFPDKSIHKFTVPAIRFLDYSIAEIEERNLTLLLPFYLLKLRQKVKAAEESGKLKELSPLVAELVDEIVKAIERCEKSGTMNQSDIETLFSMVNKLYNYIYGKYPNFKEITMLVDDMLLTHSEEAELKTKQAIAQTLIKKGWSSEEIAETVMLDVSTVESLHTGQTQGAMQS
jgi:hypothetical protein